MKLIISFINISLYLVQSSFFPSKHIVKINENNKYPFSKPYFKQTFVNNNNNNNNNNTEDRKNEIV